MPDSTSTATSNTEAGREFQKLITTLFCLSYTKEVQNEELKFEITPEDPKNGKFDDIRYEYKFKNEDKKNLFLVQVKHRETGQSTIKLNDFFPKRITHAKSKTNTNLPFLIPTYFTTFYDLKIFDTKIYRLILCTNLNIDNHVKNMWNLIETPEESLDKHLLGLFKIVKGNCYELNYNNTSNIESSGILEKFKECSESSRLAKSLVDQIQSNLSDRSSINRHNGLYKKYRNALVNIIDYSAENDTARFKIDNFKKSDKVFIREFEKHYRRAFDKDGEIEDVWDHLQNKNINVAAHFIKKASESESTFPNDEVQLDDIKKFYECFRLVCGINSCDSLKSTIVNHLKSCFSASQNNTIDEQNLAVERIRVEVSKCIMNRKESLYSREVIAWLKSISFSMDITRQDAVYRYKHFQKKSWFRISQRDLQESELYNAINDYAMLKLNTRDIKYGATMLYDMIEKKGKIHKCLFFESKDFLLNPKMFSEVFILLESPVCLLIVNSEGCVKGHNVDYLKIVTNIISDSRVFLIHETKNTKTNSVADESTIPQYNTRFNIGNLSAESQKIFFAKDYTLWNTSILAKTIFGNDEFFVEDVIEQIILGKEMGENSYIKQDYGKMEKIFVHRKRRQSNMQENSTESEQISEIYKLVNENKETETCGKKFMQNKTIQEMCQNYFLIDQQRNHDGETNGEDQTSKVIILLHEAEYEKTVYLQWLAGELHKKDKCSLITFYNLSNYNSIFEYKSNDGQDTTYLRILFLMMYLSKSPFQSKPEIASILRTMEYISFSDGKIVLKQDFEKDLTFDCVTCYKVFEEKFNNKKLMILVDGLDNVADCNKGFYYKLFYRFAQFEAVSQLYITSRFDITQHTDFKEAFNASVTVETYQLQPLSLKEKFFILRTALESQFKHFVIDDEKKHVLFAVICAVIITSLGETSNNLSKLTDSVEKFNKTHQHYITDEFMIKMELLKETVDISTRKRKRSSSDRLENGSCQNSKHLKQS